MKILIINKYFYKKGGAETVFFNMIKMLEDNGHKVIPFSLKNEKNENSKYNDYFVDYPELSKSGFLKKIRHSMSFFYNRQAAKNLKELIIKEKPDIAHIHLMFNSLSISILPVLRKYNIPVVMSVHDYRLICPSYTFIDGQGEFCERCKSKNYLNCTIHKCSQNSIVNSFMLSCESYLRRFTYSPIDYIDRFLFVSKFSMNKHVSFDKRYGDKGTYLYNFTPEVKDYSIIKGDYLFFFGRISYEKGIKTLLKAMEQMPDLKLKLAGTGPLLEKYKLDCPNNVEFLGYQHGEELRELIHKASFVIVSSECYENNPMTIIESYKIGTPVIGSRIGGIPELINEGEIGYTFKVKSVDDLVRTVELAVKVSDDAYTKMSLAAKKFAEQNFSEENYYKVLMKNYNEVMDNKKLNK